MQHDRFQFQTADFNLNLRYKHVKPISIHTFSAVSPRHSSIHQYINQRGYKVVSDVANRLNNTEAWLCSVNIANNLQKKVKQGTTLQQLDIIRIQDADQNYNRQI